MRRWVQAGGRLWVTDMGSELELLGELSNLLGLNQALIEMTKDDTDQADAGTSATAAKPGWRPVRFRRGNSQGQAVTFMNQGTGRSQVERDPERIERFRNNRNYVITAQQFDEIEERRARRRPADSERWFVEQHRSTRRCRATGIPRADRGQGPRGR